MSDSMLKMNNDKIELIAVWFQFEWTWPSLKVTILEKARTYAVILV